MTTQGFTLSVPTEVAKYSLSEKREADETTKIILSYLSNPKNTIIVDGTAGVGGNVISFSPEFKQVYAVELNPEHYQALVKNTKTLNNVAPINGNILTEIEKLDFHGLFVDPPWGGKDYKKEKFIDLFLYNDQTQINVIDFIKREWNAGCRLIVLKAPFNFNEKHLFYLKKTLGPDPIFINKYEIYRYPTAHRPIQLIYVISWHDNGSKQFRVNAYD